MTVDLCVNCNTQAGFPHAADCSGARFRGDPDVCPKGGERDGKHRFVPYVERNPYRRSFECGDCGHRPTTGLS